MLIFGVLQSGGTTRTIRTSKNPSHRPRKRQLQQHTAKSHIKNILEVPTTASASSMMTRKTATSFLCLWLMFSTSTAFHSAVHFPTNIGAIIGVPTTTTELRSAVAPMEKEETNKRRFLPRIIRTDTTNQQHTTRRRPLIQQVHTLHDYKEQVVKEQDYLVVVFFTAPWCRTCQRLEPSIRALAAKNKEVKLIQVPLLAAHTAHLCEGLEVTKFPSLHIYHPQAGLVEEQTINRRSFGEFQTLLKSYQQGSCEVEYSQDSTSNHCKM